MKPLYIFLLLAFLSANSNGQGSCINGNCKNGMGTYKWDDKSEYTGQWVDGKRTGIGVYDWPSGSFYYGYFENGKLEGKGIYIATDSKNDQIGIFHDGKYSESTSIDSVGCLVGDCKNGAGVYLWSTGDMYIGEYTNEGERTGYGRYDWKNGSIYIGYFKKGVLDGQGDYEGNDGKSMNGTFIDGQFQGTATYSNSNSSATSSTESDEVKEEDFCTVLQDIVKDYSNDFKLFRGEMNPYDSSIYDSKIKVKGTEAGVVYVDEAGYLTYWDNTLNTYTNSNDGLSTYLDYVQKIKNCSLSCGELEVLDSKSNSNDGEFKSEWRPASDGETYQDMTIELSLKKAFSGGYEITLTVLKTGY